MALFKRKDLEAQGLNENQISWLMTEAQRALGENYTTKSSVQEQIDDAVRKAQEEAPKTINVQETKEYQELASELAKTKTYTSEAFAKVKPKFRDNVWGLLDHDKPLDEQLPKIAEEYEEYFVPAEKPAEPEPSKPQFGSQDQGSMPKGKTGNSLSDLWGFGKR